ncbi:hypothetical protein EUGRSUZ_J02431 [Eucalyptus grandis]|uniref:Uncharacterized protein n=2 Tax=Eucalyptus grandis TaxID=71139 RepID=A0ACC3J8K4_EUCGR|nr:hypothetical protein EUGRSUZ_J02431 [Eucalyptus grandis]
MSSRSPITSIKEITNRELKFKSNNKFTWAYLLFTCSQQMISINDQVVLKYVSMFGKNLKENNLVTNMIYGV